MFSVGCLMGLILVASVVCLMRGGSLCLDLHWIRPGGYYCLVCNDVLIHITMGYRQSNVLYKLTLCVYNNGCSSGMGSTMEVSISFWWVQSISFTPDRPNTSFSKHTSRQWTEQELHGWFLLDTGISLFIEGEALLQTFRVVFFSLDVPRIVLSLWYEMFFFAPQTNVYWQHQLRYTSWRSDRRQGTQEICGTTP